MPVISSIFVGSRGLRSGWRILLYFALAGIPAACFLTGLHLLGVDASVRDVGLPDDPGVVALLCLPYVAFCSALLLAAFAMLKWLHRRRFAALGLGLHPRWLLELGQGALLGFMLVGVVFLVEWAAGWVEVSRPGLDVTALVVVGAVYVCLFALAAAFEELIFRGYAFQVLIFGTSRGVAVAILATLFGVAHAFNPNVGPLTVLNGVLYGVVLAVAYLRTRSLWLPTAFHWSWNWCQGVFFGFPMSGMRVEGSCFSTVSTGPDWITGGHYGPESGVLATLAAFVLLAFLLRSSAVRPAPGVDPIWEPGGAESRAWYNRVLRL